MTSSDPLITFADVTKVYSHEKIETRALDGLTFDIDAGEFVGYAGPNGAGKSTSLKAMTGVLAVTSGQVEVRGKDPLRHRQELARHAGVVLGQRTQMLWELSPHAYFKMVRALHRMSKVDWTQRLAHLTELLGLEAFINQPVRSLSLGQRMRSELAATLLPRPEILFLDEPTIGLDLEAKAALREALRELNKVEGTTIILTTHDLSDIEALCSRLMVIDHGKLAYDGSIDELFAAHSPERVVEFQLARPSEVKIDPEWSAIANGETLRITFDRTHFNATSVIQSVLAQSDVADLRIVEPDIETVIGTIYRASYRSHRDEA